MKRVCVLLAIIVIILVTPAFAHAGNGMISVSGTYDISSFGNDSVITINGGLTITLTNTGGTAYTNMQIVCGSGVRLTIDGVKIDNSLIDSSCPISFTGSGNSLVLEGGNNLHAGTNQPGIKVESLTYLEISGDGTLEAVGGSQSAGIGGGYAGSGGIITIKSGAITAQGADAGAGIGGGYAGSSGMITIEGGKANATGGSQGAGIGSGGFVRSRDTITINGGQVTANGGQYGAGIGCGFHGDGGTIDLCGGVIYAQKGPFAAFDIGNNNSGVETLSIAGDAAVFLRAGLCITPFTSHTYETVTSMTEKVYGISANGWLPPYYIYMVPYTLRYSLNGGTGIVPGSVTQHINTRAVIESGEGLNQKGGAFICWNTAADGSGKTYNPSDEFLFNTNTTLYAQYPIMISEITVTSGSDTVVNTKSLQMSATVVPADAADKSCTWSLENGTGRAVIDESGLLTGSAAGTVIVKATAKDGSGVFGTKEITVTPLLVSEVMITSGSDTVMRTQTLQMSTTILPADADDKSCTWSVENGTGKAVINSNGLLTGTAAGTVTVKAVANDGSGVSGTKEITVTPLSVTISESGIYDVVNYGNDSVISINEGLTVRLNYLGDAACTNMQIACDSGVTLTIDGVKIDDSSNGSACPLSFNGSGNILILDGESDLRAGWGQPGVKAGSGTSLQISGSGVLKAEGGFQSAGIGGGDGGDCGAVTFSGGIIFAQRGDSAPYDIGNGYSGSTGILSITSAAAVFLKTDSCITPVTSHTHKKITTVADNKVCGVSANGWAPPFGVYMVPYTLSYSLNGGMGTVPGSVTQHINTTTAISNGSGISRTHYTISEWNTEADGSGTGYNTGGNFTFTANTILYAKWVPNKYTVSFDTNGCGNAGIISADYGTKITAPVTPIRNGYTFGGWYREPGCLSAWNFGSDIVTANITLYAKWTISSYTLCYHAEANGTLMGILTQTVIYGRSGTKVTAVPKAHYHFIQWSDGVSTASRTDTNVSHEICVTAQFTINTYKVVFENYDGTILKKESVAYGGDATPPADPERTGYEFVGWDGDYYDVTNALIIMAQYREKTLKVTFSGYDGAIINTQNIPVGGEATAPDAPEREGYTFTGWDKDFTNITADVTVTAQYKVNIYEVTFKNYDGQVLGIQVVEYEHNAKAAANPEREGYIFTGWDRDYTRVKADMTITAKYSKLPEVQDIDIDGGEATVILSMNGLDVAAVNVEGGDVTVNTDGTVTMRIPNGVKPGGIEVTFMLENGSTTAVIISEEDLAAAGIRAGNTATEGLQIWIWIIIGVGGVALIVTAVLLIEGRKRGSQV